MTATVSEQGPGGESRGRRAPLVAPGPGAVGEAPDVEACHAVVIAPDWSWRTPYDEGPKRAETALGECLGS